ncbi:hypothetical protein [Dactylosporangium sp. CA-092794]|uniref:hypothetical protein n=1 Tax=Dactylosporangium sp. CA-092794 TaxID=3239929 RepID=UPI003D93E0D4
MSALSGLWTGQLRKSTRVLEPHPTYTRCHETHTLERLCITIADDRISRTVALIGGLQQVIGMLAARYQAT